MRAWIGIAAALFLVVVFFVVRRVETSSAPAPSAATSSAKPEPEALSRPSDPLEAGAAAKTARESASGAAPSVGEHRDELFGRVVDGHDAPVAGANLEAFLDDVGRGAIGEPRVRSSLARATSDEMGAFTLRVVRGLPCELEVAHEGFAPARLSYRAAGEELLVRLARPAVLVVHVVRDDGTPACDVPVRVGPVTEGGFASFAPFAAARTDALGTARFDALPLGAAMIDVAPGDGVVPRPVRVELVAGELVDRTFTIARGTTVRGKVIDLATKAPIAGAELGIGPSLDGRRVRSDAQGEYTWSGVPTDRPFFLHVEARGYGHASKTVKAGASEPALERVDFGLVAARRARGRVLGPDGTPIANARVEARGTRGGVDAFDARATRTDSDGLFELVDLRADVPHELGVAARGIARTLRPFPADEQRTPIVELGDVVLERAAVASGRVLDAKGLPLAGQRLVARVLELPPSGAAQDGNARTPPPRQRMRELELRADHLGRFVIADLPAGRLVVEAEVAGARERPKLDVEVKAGEERTQLVLVVDLGLVIAGRVLDPGGAPLAMVNLSLRTESGALVGHAPLRTGSDGAFVVPMLEKGRYRVLAWPENRDGNEADGTLYSNRVVDDVAAGTSGLDIVLAPGKRTRGQVLGANGAPLPSVYVAAKDERGNSLTAVLTDSNGRFELLLDPEREHELEARPPAKPGEREDLKQAPDPATFARAKGVRGGAQDVELRFR